MLLTKDDVFFVEEKYTKNELLYLIAKNAQERKFVSDSKKVYEDFLKREAQYSTAVVEHVAIPHAKSKYVEVPKVFFIKTKYNIDWASEENFKVNLIFGILVPEDESGTTHLQIISSIATKLLDENFINKLQKASNKEKIVELILN